MRAVVESRRHLAAAMGAFQELSEAGRPSVDRDLAVPAKEERLAPPDRDQRYEKEADILIDSIFIGLVQATTRTPSGGVIDRAPSGLNTGNEKTHSGFIFFKVSV